MKKASIIILLMSCALFVCAQDSLMGRRIYAMHVAVQNMKGQHAPEFSAVTLTGKPVNIAMLKGKIVVLSVWMTTCGPCIREMNSFKSFQNKYKGQNIEYIAISPIDKEQDIKDFLLHHDLYFKVWYSPSANFVKDYTAEEYPTNYVIDRMGIIRYAHVGYNKFGVNEISAAVEGCM